MERFYIHNNFKVSKLVQIVYNSNTVLIKVNGLVTENLNIFHFILRNNTKAVKIKNYAIFAVFAFLCKRYNIILLPFVVLQL